MGRRQSVHLPPAPGPSEHGVIFEDMNFSKEDAAGFVISGSGLNTMGFWIGEM